MFNLIYTIYFLILSILHLVMCELTCILFLLDDYYVNCYELSMFDNRVGTVGSTIRRWYLNDIGKSTGSYSPWRELF